MASLNQKATTVSVNQQTLADHSLLYQRTHHLSNLHANQIQKNQINITHWNVNGIQSKKGMLEEFINEFDPDIITLNEIRISNDALLNTVMSSFRKYDYVAKLRKDQLGGGVLIMIKNNLEYEEIKLNYTAEIVGLTIKLSKGNMLHLYTYYVPPHRKINERILKKIHENSKSYIITGDLNAHMTSYKAKENNTNGTILEKFISECDCCIINKKDTYTYIHSRFLPKSNKLVTNKSILDYFLATPNIATKLTSIKPIKGQLLSSDHIALMGEFKLKHQTNQENETPIERMRFDKANWKQFQLLMKKTTQSPSIETMYEEFITNINEAVRLTIPITSKGSKVRGESLPQYIINLKNAKNKLITLTEQCRTVETLNALRLAKIHLAQSLLEFHS